MSSEKKKKMTSSSSSSSPSSSSSSSKTIATSTETILQLPSVIFSSIHSYLRVPSSYSFLHSRRDAYANRKAMGPLYYNPAQDGPILTPYSSFVHLTLFSSHPDTLKLMAHHRLQSLHFAGPCSLDVDLSSYRYLEALNAIPLSDATVTSLMTLTSLTRLTTGQFTSAMAALTSLRHLEFKTRQIYRSDENKSIFPPGLHTLTADMIYPELTMLTQLRELTVKQLRFGDNRVHDLSLLEPLTYITKLVLLPPHSLTRPDVLLLDRFKHLEHMELGSLVVFTGHFALPRLHTFHCKSINTVAMQSILALCGNLRDLTVTEWDDELCSSVVLSPHVRLTLSGIAL